MATIKPLPITYITAKRTYPIKTFATFAECKSKSNFMPSQSRRANQQQQKEKTTTLKTMAT